MVDAADSKSAGGNTVRVQVSPLVKGPVKRRGFSFEFGSLRYRPEGAYSSAENISLLRSEDKGVVSGIGACGLYAIAEVSLNV